MSRRLISTGSPFEKTAGYSRAVIDGEFVFVSGTTGYDYATMTMPESVEQQTRNAFATIEKALREAGATFADVVQTRYYLTDAATADELFKVTGEIFGEIRPASAVLVCGLLKPEMKVEVEVTARVRVR
ncbi:RidA family protein [Methylopila henanensis]|uniref:RidA family protein n=1 Tax=Methylopila henanensis TaxID=873516 RepID=A0ABW4KBA9_9HYPH